MEKYARSANGQSRRPGLPLLLYDLRAASQLLPSAAILPEQFYGSRTGSEAAQAEVALMRAVLEDALHCFHMQSAAPGRRASRLEKEAEDWFFTDDYTWPCSFTNICSVLGLEPEYIRGGIRRWRDAGYGDARTKKRRTVVSRRPLKIAA